MPAATLWLAAVAVAMFETLALAASALCARLRLTLRTGALALLASTSAPLGAFVLAPRLAQRSALWWLDLLSAMAAIAAGAVLAAYAVRLSQPATTGRLRQFTWGLAMANALLLGALWYAQYALWGRLSSGTMAAQ